MKGLLSTGPTPPSFYVNGVLVNDQVSDTLPWTLEVTPCPKHSSTSAIILDCTSGEGICLIYSDEVVYCDQTKIHMYPIRPILRSGPSSSPAGQ